MDEKLRDTIKELRAREQNNPEHHLDEAVETLHNLIWREGRRNDKSYLL